MHRARVDVLGLYELTMQQLCVAVGLPIPSAHRWFPPFNGNRHLLQQSSTSCDPVEIEAVIDAEIAHRLSDGYSVENVYLHAETSSTWTTFLKSRPPIERLRCAVRRRISLAIYDALRSFKCFYCWLPSTMCMCGRLLDERELVRASFETVASDNEMKHRIKATMLLHSEELLRMTNTGHLVAFVLNSEVRVWGVADDDAWLATVAAQNEALGRSVASDASMERGAYGAPDDDVLFSVLLYPESGSTIVGDLGKKTIVACPPPKHPPNPNQLKSHTAPCVIISNDDEGSPPINTPSKEVAPLESEGAAVAFTPDVQNRGLHVILSDGTWGQAHRVNRHVPRAIPRVSLVIDAEYESLFAPLRKQTRSTGVSTLEATVMALAQILRRTSGGADVATVVEAANFSVMKRYVDLVSIQKRQNPVFGTGDGNDVAETKRQRRQHHLDIMEEERRRGRRVPTPERLATDEYRRLAVAPVLSYCYVCDMFIGWSRMPGHVLGTRHKELLKQNPSGTPSSKAQLMESANMHVRCGAGHVPLLPCNGEEHD